MWNSANIFWSPFAISVELINPWNIRSFGCFQQLWESHLIAGTIHKVNFISAQSAFLQLINFIVAPNLEHDSIFTHNFFFNRGANKKDFYLHSNISKCAKSEICKEIYWLNPLRLYARGCFIYRKLRFLWKEFFFSYFGIQKSLNYSFSTQQSSEYKKIK